MQFKYVDYTTFKEFVDNRKANVHYLETVEEYELRAANKWFSVKTTLPKGSLSFVDDIAHFEATYKAGGNVDDGNFYLREPFATKQLKDGSKLYRRKHGQKATIPANSELDIEFNVPYTKAKINKLEVIDANPLDRLDLLVKSPSEQFIADLYGMPVDTVLNQFGFDVSVGALLYSDKSDYDADVYQHMRVVVRYKNDTATPKDVGFNLIYHEVVSP